MAWSDIWEEGPRPQRPVGRKEAEALAYMSSEVHATCGGHFNTQKFAESEAAQEEVKRRTYEKLAVTPSG